MAKTGFRDADEYIGSRPEGVQKVLGAVRRAIRKAVPEAEEVISCQIPAFKHHGWVFYYSAHRNHYSLSWPSPSKVVEAFEERLAPYGRAKRTIRFPMQEPVPEDLITAMAVFKARENEEKAQAKQVSVT